MNAGKVNRLYPLFMLLFFLGVFQSLKAQNDYRVPFKHRIGSTAIPNNIFQIRGDFALIGNTNLTLKDYSLELGNSAQEMVFVDIDKVPETFNSSSATLMFSDENGADPNCTDILYAGLYWSGRVQTPGLTFEIKKQDGFLNPVTLNGKKEIVGRETKLEYFPYTVAVAELYDWETKIFPQYEILSDDGQSIYMLRFTNDHTVEYNLNYIGWMTAENLQITQSNGMATATFSPIQFESNGMKFEITGLNRSMSNDYSEFIESNNSILLVSSGTYRPASYITHKFDKRKLKFKPPGASAYQEIVAAGNAILFPDQELKDIYVGYADVTNVVKEYGAGEYTVADLALTEGYSDETGMLGNWGLIVVYQNSKMNLRDVTIFDGYTFIQAWEGTAQNGEIEVKGFGAIEEGPVSLRLGLMASEGDNIIGGDYLEILDQKGNWTRLSHPGNDEENFFNSSIYTPIRMKNGNLVHNPRFPNLKNNTGIDLVQWEVPNPGNSLIANNQSSTKFRYGTNQDLFALYAMALSVSSNSPNIEAQNQIKTINDAPVDDTSTIKPGEKVVFQVDIRNKGTEITEQNKLVIPVPFNAVFVEAEIIPSGYGTVRFDPNAGVTGSIVWDMGDIPVLNSSNEVIASLSYILKFTEDCFVLANDNCESLLSIDGSISGIGSVSKQRFTGLPFIKGYKEEACEGTAIYGPIEIPISGKAEFAASHCGDFQLFTELKLDHIPIFCHRDSPTALADLVLPSQDGFEVYFFTDEIGGNPLINYYVNTSLVGTETIWVSEGPQGSCTGMRIPLELKVIPSSPEPTAKNLSYCMEAKSIPYELTPTPGYSLLYYKDNQPGTAPMSGAPLIDLSAPKTQFIWVSQVKEGECESPRKEVSIYIEDCSLRPQIEITVTSNLELFTDVGEEVIFTITVKNPGKTPLYNVYLNEYLYYNHWDIAELGPKQEQSFEVKHTTTATDLLYAQVFMSADTGGYDELGTFVSGSDSKIVSSIDFTPGFLDYSLDLAAPPCEGGENGKGQLILTWSQSQQGSYILTDLETGILGEIVNFPSRNQLVIEVPVGNYAVELTDENGNTHKIDSVTIEGKGRVEFDVPDRIVACGEYIWIPEMRPNVIFSLTAPDGTNVIRHMDGSFSLVQSGTYSVRATSGNSELCPAVKTFESEITLPEEVEIDIRPFCSEDSSTTVDLIENSDGLAIRWYKKAANGIEELTAFANSRLLIASEGNYQVRLSDDQGCLVGKTDFEVSKSITQPPVLSSIYTFCPRKRVGLEIEPGERFKEASWMLNGVEVSNALVFVPLEAGQYQLEAKDAWGCSFFSEFEVEEKCDPELRFPNAIWIDDPTRFFEIYPDNLVDEFEIKIFNRWGQLIYHCEDKALENEVKSRCVWDGTYNGDRVTTGSYAVIIQLKNYKQNLTRSIRTSVMVMD
jgi:hypothetical protein